MQNLTGAVVIGVHIMIVIYKSETETYEARLIFMQFPGIN